MLKMHGCLMGRGENSQITIAYLESRYHFLKGLRDMAGVPVNSIRVKC